MPILRSVWLRNNTAGSLEFQGIEIFANSMEDFSYQSDIDLQTDPILVAAIKAGTISVGDGTLFFDGNLALTHLIDPMLPTALAATGMSGAFVPKVLFRHNGRADTGIEFSKGFVAIPFPNLLRSDYPYTYNADTKGITVNENGWYKIVSQLSFKADSDHPSCRAALFINGSLQSGSNVWYAIKREHASFSLTVQYMAMLLSGDVIDIRARATKKDGDLETIKRSCNILIERL